MKSSRLAAVFAVSLTAAGTVFPPAHAGTGVDEPVMEASTLHSLGMHWIVSDNESRNAEIRVAWRKPGGDWKEAASLFRVEKGANKPEKTAGSLDVPDSSTLFAGSVVSLEPGADYEVKLNLVTPAGSGREEILKARTLAEPIAPGDCKVFHVVPGNGGGTGSEADPFRGLQAAQGQARPGTIFQLRAGAYPASFNVITSGEPGRPIIWRGASDGETIIDGSAAPERRVARLISADNVHDVWFENLTLQNGGKGFAGNGGARLVVRHCHIRNVEYGIFATRDDADTLRGWFVADNIIEGPSTWPRTKGIENARGVQITGEGHVICYNRIRGFADAIDTYPSRRCANIDFHNNEISEMTDDGIELDFSERNVRCFANRLTNVFQGISAQPVYGGPVYVFRNAIYNVIGEPFKLHNSPSGALFIHNTTVKAGMPLLIYTEKPVRHCLTRNNLFIGTTGTFAFESTAKMRECDFDYDGVGGGPWGLFMKWSGVRYASLEAVRERGPAWKHTVLVESASAFASGVLPPENGEAVHQAADLRLKAGTAAIDAGLAMHGFNDGFSGSAPDLGAYEFGTPLPHYGPRPQMNR
jgi:Right handed beta helix region